MRTFLLRRLLMIVPVILLVSIIAFGLVMILPGDAALAMLGDQGANDPVRYEAARRELGLDQPIPIQYLNWLGRTLQGDFGTSIRTKESVSGAILTRLEPTIQLGLVALVIALVIAIPTAIISALHPGSWIDAAGTTLAVAGMAIPGFWLGIMLIYLFAVWLRWLPPSGFVPLGEDPVESMRRMILPALVVATWITVPIMRQLRSSLIEVMENDYVRTARGKGLRENRVVTTHAMRNALIPVLTVIGGIVGRIYAGTVIAETIFSIPGIGRLATDSLVYRDFPVIQGIVLVAAISVLVANLLTDVLYAYVDPRIRYT